MEKMDIKEKKCMTPEFRVSFPQVFEPKAFQGQEPKYSVVMLFDKKTDLKALKDAAFNAAKEMWGEKAKWPKNFKMPFRDGDEKADQLGYAGKIFVTATSKKRPGVVNQKLDDIVNKEEFYAGCYARAVLIAFAYSKAGNAGVSFALQHVQKLRDGEKFGGGKAARDEFSVVDDGSEDAGNYSDDDTGF